jgi:hypothetical protein
MNPLLALMHGSEPSRETPRTSAVVELMLLIRAGRIAQSINVAARLGVADQLADGPRRASDLASSVGADPVALGRLLRLLAGVGVFAEVAEDSNDAGVGKNRENAYVLTYLGELLRRDREGGLRDLAMLLESPFWRAGWTDLIEGVRSGGAPFGHAHGQQLFEYLGSHPDDAALFDQTMTAFSRGLSSAVLDAYDFSRFRTVADVGGGNGALLAAILARHPGLRGTLVELPEVAARAPGLLSAAGVADRCEVVEGDMFESVSPGRDAYVMSRIIHDWDDQAAARILENCRSAMRADGRVLLVEIVLPDASESSDSSEALLAKLWDMEMFMVGGKERTRGEYRDLLARAGLRLLRTVPTAAVYHVIEAAAAS